MYAPLYQALQEHRAKQRASFHTPGHKNSPLALPDGLYALDFTELPDTDSLFEASGAIREAELAAARLFGARRTLISAGGCSLCIQAMLRLALPQGGQAVCGRVVHRSAVNAMALLDLEPVWAPNSTAGILKKLEQTPQAGAVYVTSPSYYGQLMDIPALAEACKRRGIPLLVDNAHGAHLAFTEPRLHPLQLGASMTACSAHKTLGVLTGGAWLNIADERYCGGAKQAMSLFASTSPNYMVMASLDWARAWLEEHAALAYPVLQARVAALREQAAALGFGFPQGRCDPTRLTLDASPLGFTGEEAARRFRAEGVECEMADGAYVVFIATPFNSDADFDRLARALPRVAAKRGEPQGRTGGTARGPFPAIAPAKLRLRAAVFAPHEEIPLAFAAGRIAAEAACPCPPGIPVVMPGDIITPEAAEFLKSYGFFTIKVLK